jgi:serine/threonine-protein kinase
MSVTSANDDVLEEGQIVDGRYLIESVIGVGGMSVVYHATHLLLDRPVALKVVSRALSSIPDARKRFLREARAIARIKNEHVVTVHDVGVLEDGQPFLVMERLSGRDLGDMVDSSGPLPLEIAVYYMLQACAGLAEVHARGIVHRDLKPSNLFVAASDTGAPHLKILDFGVSKLDAPDTANMRLTHQGAIVGTPAYMAPEQMRSSSGVDPRADIWSLGIVLYELVSGVLPFESDTLADLLAELLTRPPPKLSARRKEVPPGLDEVLARCYAFEPKMRHANVVALAAALAPYGPPGSREVAAAIATAWDRGSMRPPALSESDESMPSISQARIAALGGPISEKALAHSENPVVVSNRPSPPPSARPRDNTTMSEPQPRVRRRKVAAVAFTLGAAALVAIGVHRHHAASGDGATAMVQTQARAPAAPTEPATVTIDDIDEAVAADDAARHNRPRANGNDGAGRKPAPAMKPARPKAARSVVAAIPTLIAETKAAAAPPAKWEPQDDEVTSEVERTAAASSADLNPSPPPARAALVIDGTPVPGAQIRSDGVPLAVVPDAPISIEPGPHKITAVVSGLTVWAAKIDAREGTVIHVRIPAAYATAYDKE